MGQAALYSCLLHVFIILLAWVGLPSLKSPDKPLPQPIPIEILTVSEETQAPKPMPVAEKPKPAEKKPEPVKEPVKPTLPKPEPVVEPPVPTPPVETKPEEVKPDPLPEPIKEPLTEPDPTPVPSPKPTPVAPAPKPSLPKPKPPVPPKEKEKKKDPPPQETFESILKNLEKIEQKSQDDADKSKTATDAKSAQNVGKESDQLSISEMDKLRTHFKNCWSLPAGAQNAENLSVQIKISASPDGMVKEAQVVEKGRMASDPYFRIAAESALRAARDPQCAKLPLSLDKYEVWKVMILNFDPRFLLGG